MSHRNAAALKGVKPTTDYWPTEAKSKIIQRKATSNGVLARLEHKQAITALTTGTMNSKTFTTKIKVVKHPEYKSINVLETEFFLQDAVDKKGFCVGRLNAQTIDRQSEGLSKAPYLDELLEWDLVRPMSHAADDSTVDEIKVIMRHIFDHNGVPRAEYQHRPLGSADLHFVAMFELDDEFKGPGLAQLALKGYHEAIGHLPGAYAFKGTVVLSPAALRGKKEAKAGSGQPEKSYVEIEHCLILSYRKSGYKVWSKADDGLEGSGIIIMGRSVGQLSDDQEDHAAEAEFPPFVKTNGHAPLGDDHGMKTSDEQEIASSPTDSKAGRKETGVEVNKPSLKRKPSELALDQLPSSPVKRRRSSLSKMVSPPETRCKGCHVVESLHHRC